MQRTIISLLIGFAIGAGAAYGVLYEPDRKLKTDPVSAVPGTPAPSEREQELSAPLAPTAPAIAERARVYQSVSAAGIDELRAMARGVLDDSDARGRSFELDVVIARMIEIDPEAALAFVRDNDAGAARTLSVAVSAVARLGYGEAAISEVLAALPALDAEEFRAAALEGLAATDPARALAIGLADFEGRGSNFPAFTPYEGRIQALLRIASTWAYREPEGALAAIDAIANPQLRMMLTSAMLGRLTRSDPDAALARVRAMDVPPPQKSGLMRSAIMQLATREPEQAVRYAATLDGQDGQIALMMALQQWAQRDPEAAVDYVERMPAGMMRENLVQQVASAYGRNDPDGALAWARSSNDVQSRILSGVLAGIAQTDPMRALDIALEESPSGLPPSGRMEMLMSVIGNASAQGSMPHRALGERVLAIENYQVRDSALNMLGQRWAATDPNGALTWFLDNQASIGADSLNNLAHQIGRQDPRSAADQLGRVPPAARDEWIAAIAVGYAETDPSAARSWVQRFRGEPVYETAITRIIQSTAGLDPAAAASLWASTDFDDESLRTSLAGMVAGNWAVRDPTSARNWVAALPRGETRDEALIGIVRTGQELPDGSVLGLFSNGERRLEAVQDIVMRTAQYDPERARRLVEEHFQDPARRAELERMIDDMAARESAPGSVFFGPQSFAPGAGIRRAAPVIVR